jgi:hypothetical protein
LEARDETAASTRHLRPKEKLLIPQTWTRITNRIALRIIEMAVKLLMRTCLCVAQFSIVTFVFLAAVGQSQAQKNAVDNWDYFVGCLGWMISDPVAHMQNCTSRTVLAPLASLATPVSGSEIGRVVYRPCVIIVSTADGETKMSEGCVPK